jgi:hypothetical protein
MAKKTRLIAHKEEERAPTRKMSVIAQDPGIRRRGKILMAKIDVPAEDLAPGPIGYRVQVVDYDGARQEFCGSHVLPGVHKKEPAAWTEGRATILNNFSFHAQNVYALVMKTLARFEYALGRRIPWSRRSFKSHQLKVAPHGMADANAFYNPEIEGLVFGYFNGASGERVYTCLSHDVVVHETTHALLDALRERYMDPSSPDQAAFHEGFSDVIALLSVFSQREVVEYLLLGGKPAGKKDRFITRASVQYKALLESALFALAKQMGSELNGVRGQPLRQSAKIKPDPKLKDTDEYLEPHRRGELLVAAVMQGFVKAWSERILTSGLDKQQAYPVSRVAEEGADIADKLATMWIRAIDYMPPVHLTFGDALSAALTADFEVRPDDSRYELRAHMRESFAAFGFKPASRREDGSGLWADAPQDLNYERVRFESMKTDEDEVFRFIWDNRTALELCDGAYTQVLSVRPSVRIGIDGFVLRETVAEYYQVARFTREEMKERGVKPPQEYLDSLIEAEMQVATEADGGDDGHAHASDPATAKEVTTALYGGAVLIFDEYGRVKYWIHNDVLGKDQNDRLAYLWEQGQLGPDQTTVRLREGRFSALHRLRALGAVAGAQTREDRW